MDMENHAMVRAEVLTEALPYIQKFRDDIVVIKFGGSAILVGYVLVLTLGYVWALIVF